MIIDEAIAAGRAIYARNSVGCCLHIVLDDDNIKDEHVMFAAEWARDKGHPDCIALADALVAMSEADRRTVALGVT